MHKSALAGLSLFILTIIATSSPKAAALSILELQSSETLALAQTSDDSINSSEQSVMIAPETEGSVQKPVTKEVTKHTVAENESLSKIAKKYKTTWVRLFDKNTEVKNPDVITIGQELTIPKANETLQSRPLPKVEVEAVVQTKVQVNQPISRKPVVHTVQQKPRAAVKTQPAPQRTKSYSYTRGASSGNLYTPGNCTWYAKSRRPDLPNNLGNADTWVARARAQGIPTGSTPRAGAVGQRGMHVVYVKSVNRDGTVNIIEMNHKGLYVITERTLPGNYFSYIY